MQCTLGIYRPKVLVFGRLVVFVYPSHGKKYPSFPNRDGKDDDDDDDGDKDQVDGGSSVAMWPGLSENLKSWSARSGQFFVLY